MPRQQDEQQPSAIDAALAALESASGTGGTRAGSPTQKTKTPIGGDYASAQVTDQNTPGLRRGDLVPDLEANVLGVRPGYFDGDEWMFQKNGLAAEDIAQVQVLLVQAGLLTDDVPIGAWEQKSASAFKKILELANRTGVDWSTALLNYDQAPTLAEMLGTAGTKRAPFQARVSNPDDLKEVFKQTAYNVLGGKFTDEAQLQRFVDTYHEQEIKSQRAAYGAAVSGGVTVEQPQADTAALEQLKTDDPAGYSAATFANYGRQIRELLSAGGTA